MMYAYAASRAKTRVNRDGMTRHAVEESAVMCGALDTECGRPVIYELGPWEPDNPHNCHKCARLIEGRTDVAA